MESCNEATFITLSDIPTCLSKFLWFSITRTLWLLTTGSVLSFWFSLLGFFGLAVCFIGLVSCSNFFSSHFQTKLLTCLWCNSVILIRSLLIIISWSIYAQFYIRDFIIMNSDWSNMNVLCWSVLLNFFFLSFLLRVISFFFILSIINI